MKLVFVHGWSVTTTKTYGKLPQALVQQADAAGLSLETSHIHIGRYISFRDEVSMGDVVRAFDRAIRDQLAPDGGDFPAFSCVVHSTGAPIVREWVEKYFGSEKLADLPMQHLVMMAPANHGSPLAALGKKTVGKIKAFMQGIEPGQRILDWLCLGSDGQWQLAHAELDYKRSENGYFQFVLAGQTIDDRLYDHLNNYTGEDGSDGVIRVAGTNMNYRSICLEQSEDTLPRRSKTFLLKIKGTMRIPETTPIGVIDGVAHSGPRIGIMASVTPENAANKPIVSHILDCLKVSDQAGFDAQLNRLKNTTSATQGTKARFSMFVFQVSDDQGERIKDYDLLILSDDGYSPDKLPRGFFRDRQYNKSTGRLVYYMNQKKLRKMTKIGLRVTARPNKGFAYYDPVEFRSEEIPIADIVRANETIYVDIVLKRNVAQNTFDLVKVGHTPASFKRIGPSDETL